MFSVLAALLLAATPDGGTVEDEYARTFRDAAAVACKGKSPAACKDFNAFLAAGAPALAAGAQLFVGRVHEISAFGLREAGWAVLWLDVKDEGTWAKTFRHAVKIGDEKTARAWLKAAEKGTIRTDEAPYEALVVEPKKSIAEARAQVLGRSLIFDAGANDATPTAFLREKSGRLHLFYLGRVNTKPVVVFASFVKGSKTMPP